jgi:hypothetical protein
MKKMSLFLLLVAGAAHAIPTTVSYVATVENASGPFNGTASVGFALYDAATGGNSVWSEQAASLDITAGELVHDLGSVTPLDTVVLANNDLFLEMTIDGTTLSRSPMRAVPFALVAQRAAIADSVEGLNVADLATRADLAAAVAAPVQFSQIQNLPPTLADGQIAFSELVGLDPSLADNVDNDTVYSAGTGIALSGTTFSVAANGVTSANIVAGTITSDDIAPGAVTAGKLAANAIGEAQVGFGAITSDKVAFNQQLIIRVINTACAQAGNLTNAINCARVRGTCAVAELRVCSTGACAVAANGSCTNEIIGMGFRE